MLETLLFVASLQVGGGEAPSPQPTRVDPAELCRVQGAIRWREPAWSDAQCRRVAGAFNRARDPRLLEAVCIVESDLRSGVVTLVRPGVYDVGLCGVRCVLGGDGRCSNGPARGHTLRQLLDGPTNARVADRILHVKHGGNLRHYNGGTREHGYAARVGAVLASLCGVDAFAGKRRPREGRRESRVEKLTRLILSVVRGAGS